MTTEQQADKVTFSCWGCMIVQPQRAAERNRGRWGQILNNGVKRWEKFAELWLRIARVWNWICGCTGETNAGCLLVWGQRANMILHFNKFDPVQCVSVCVCVSKAIPFFKSLGHTLPTCPWTSSNRTDQSFDQFLHLSQCIMVPVVLPFSPAATTSACLLGCYTQSDKALPAVSLFIPCHLSIWWTAWLH